MSDLNVCSFTGRVTQDAALRMVGAKNTSICNFSIANNTGFGAYAKTQFFKCCLWGKRGEALQQYLVKGKQVAVTGVLEDNTWTGQDGVKHRDYQLNCTDVILMASAKGTAIDEITDGSEYDVPEVESFGQNIPF